MLNKIENLITLLLNDFLSQGYKTEICLNNSNINNNNNELEVNDNTFYTCGNERQTTAITTSTLERSLVSVTTLSLDKLYYGRLCSRKRFASFLYVLAEVHDLFLSRSHCTYRQLYYRNVNIECTTLQIQCAVNDVCQALGTTSWNLGIFAAGKCFISGPLLVHMSNGDVIDCDVYKGPTLMPPNFTYIDKFVTTAKFVLVVEKDTVFENLIVNGIFSMLNGSIILVTARGYPDISTRWILHKLWIENQLPIYALVDGDPFGIEIMLIYRYGSMRQGLNANNLTCPQLKWLGIHPSDISHLMTQTEPLAENDYNKIKSLLHRSYIDHEIRTELLILHRLQCKVKIDNMSANMLNLFISDYIVNKIKRQIVL
ncbi:meiotic recombination protein W68 [Lucilia cuprina]|uniref:meiotic recombination protein W68 n=1 Tax=Lucilia cuprina TaxID=7375 RepID=UPI001F059D33|nr:meiotic recombination protein W68 [Lucilia cuprina]